MRHSLYSSPNNTLTWHGDIIISILEPSTHTQYAVRVKPVAGRFGHDLDQIQTLAKLSEVHAKQLCACFGH